MKTKLKRLKETFERRENDRMTHIFFNEATTEIEQVYTFAEELEYTELSKQLKQSNLIGLLSSCYRLRNGVVRNIKQLRSHKGYKSVLINSRNNG